MSAYLDVPTHTTTKTNTEPPIRVRSVRVLDCQTRQEIPCTFRVSGKVVKVYYPSNYQNVNIWVDYYE